MVQPRKARPCLTERLLMGRKESNQTKQTNVVSHPAAIQWKQTHYFGPFIYFAFISSKGSEKVGIRRMGLGLYHHIFHLCSSDLPICMSLYVGFF